ncbi:hypothetical protein SLA2020_264440 [Shorea laevis]
MQWVVVKVSSLSRRAVISGDGRCSPRNWEGDDHIRLFFRKLSGGYPQISVGGGVKVSCNFGGLGRTPIVGGQLRRLRRWLVQRGSPVYHWVKGRRCKLSNRWVVSACARCWVRVSRFGALCS